MKLIDNEKILMKNTSEEMTLTNYRVIKSRVNGSITSYSSVPLEKISSIQFKSHNSRWTLYSGLLFCLLGVIIGFNAQDPVPKVVGICLFGGFFIAAYFMTRLQILEIHAIGGERIESITKEEFESAFNFIHAIEHVSKTGVLPSSTENVVTKSKSA